MYTILMNREELGANPRLDAWLAQNLRAGRV